MKNLKLWERVHELKSFGTSTLKTGYSPVNFYVESALLNVVNSDETVLVCIALTIY